MYCYCIVLYCWFVLYYYCIVLYCIIIFCTAIVLYCVDLSCTAIVLYCIQLYCIVLCWFVLYCYCIVLICLLLLVSWSRCRVQWRSTVTDNLSSLPKTWGPRSREEMLYTSKERHSEVQSPTIPWEHQATQLYETQLNATQWQSFIFYVKSSQSYWSD